MNLEALILPTQLRDYAKDRGWVLVREAAKHRLYVMNHPDFPMRQLVFPMDTTVSDYSDAIQRTIDKLAEMERRDARAVFKSLIEVGDDGISFRVTAPRPDLQSIPLAFAGAMLTGAQQLLLASACTVLRPRAHHPRLGGTEAQQLLETAKFQHTQPGSFVLNVSCPVQGVEAQAPLLLNETDAPFARRTTLTLKRSLEALVTAIEGDALEDLVATSKNNPALVSSNLCEALTQFEDATLKNSIEIGISWAASIPRPVDEPRISTVRIQHDYFAKIADVSRALRATEQYVADTFPGTVETLNGTMGPEGVRAGEVILSLLLRDGGQVRARANLNAQQYAEAITAHKTDGLFVIVAGTLHPGRQPRQLSDVTRFEPMSQ